MQPYLHTYTLCAESAHYILHAEGFDKYLQAEGSGTSISVEVEQGQLCVLARVGTPEEVAQEATDALAAELQAAFLRHGYVLHTNVRLHDGARRLAQGFATCLKIVDACGSEVATGFRTVEQAQGWAEENMGGRSWRLRTAV